MEKVKIDSQNIGKRLDVFMTETLGSISRAAIQKAIKDGLILVNGKKVTPHLALREDDEINFGEIVPTSQKATEPKPRPDIRLEIIHEDDDIIVVNKPSGLLVHPTNRNEKESLAAALLAHYPKISGVGDGIERPGIMQRLDKEASGIMVIAKNQKAYDFLKAQFMNHGVIKHYQILVHNRPPEDQGTINLAIGRSRSERRMAARSTPLDGDRPAVTHYSVLRHLRESTLIKAKTETGRTHQIRAHFKAIGCPVAGDKLYGHKTDKLGSKRLFLHAETLGFIHPKTKELVTFHAPLPKELEKVIENLSLAGTDGE